MNQMFVKSQICIIIAPLILGGFGMKQFVNLDSPPELDPVEDTVRYVFIISRAGPRAPRFEPYPNDEAARIGFKKYWGVEKGQLTKDGRRLMSALGTSLYSRYKNILPKLSSKIVTSHKSPRTKLGAELVAEKLFMEALTVDTNTNDWDKYTMITSDNEEDQPCKHYYQARNLCSEWQLLHGDLDKNMDIYKISDFCDDIRRFTGLEGKLDWVEVMKVFDTFEMKVANNKEIMPDWIERRLELNYLISKKTSFATGGCFGRARQLTIAPMLHQIFEELEQCKETCRGIHLHVTHSAMISTLLAAFGLTTYEPFPGITVMVEIHEKNLVKVLLYLPFSWSKNEKPGTLDPAMNENWVVVAMKDFCRYTRLTWDSNKSAVTCTLHQFKSTLTAWSPDEWNKQCNL